MGKRQAKPAAGKKRSRRSKPATDNLPRPSLLVSRVEPPEPEPSPEELRELEVSVEREEARQRLLGLAHDYPRADRPLVEPLTDALKAVPGMKPVKARLIAQSLKQLADKAHDLDEIVGRILKDKHQPGEVAELVLAFQIVIEQLCNYADVLEEKLYDVFDRAKGLK